MQQLRSSFSQSFNPSWDAWKDCCQAEGRKVHESYLAIHLHGHSQIASVPEMTARRRPEPALQMTAVRRLATASPVAASMRPSSSSKLNSGAFPETAGVPEMRARRRPEPALQMMAVRRLATASPVAAIMLPSSARDEAG